jgi:hypothetical protein
MRGSKRKKESTRRMRKKKINKHIHKTTRTTRQMKQKTLIAEKTKTPYSE